MLLLTLRDLQYRARRFAISTIGTGLVFMLVLVMIGIYMQLRNEPKKAVQNLHGSGVWVVGLGGAGVFTGTSRIPTQPPLPQAIAGGRKLLVSRGTVRIQDSTDENDCDENPPPDACIKDVVFVGYEPGQQGDEAGVLAMDLGPGEVIADSSGGWPDDARIGLGDERNLTITQQVDGHTVLGGTPMVFLPLDALRSHLENTTLITTVLMDEAPPEDEARYRVVEPQDVWEDAYRPLRRPTSTILGVAVLLCLVAASIVGAIVYLSALERLRDFAVMKAVGASDRGLGYGLGFQAIVVAVVAAVFAIILLLLLLAANVFPIRPEVPAWAYAGLPVAAAFVGALASLGGLRKAISVDPALAFSGPGG